MQIAYASHHTWYKYSVDNSLNHYGKNDRKRLTKTLEQAVLEDVTYEFKPVDEAFLTWFLPMYERIIGTKKNPHIFDITNSIKSPKELSQGYITLTVYDHGQIVGGCIFNDFGWYYSIAYRVYEPHWPQTKLQASPSFFGELQLDLFTKQQGRKMLSHGKDRNPYGLNSSIGLCIFKLATGCKPRTALTYELRQMDTNVITEDCLILHHPHEGRVITDATLICTNKSENRYRQLKSYPERLTIHTIIRPSL